MFFLTGNPGTGKSAMLAHLVHRHPLVVAYHFCVSSLADSLDPNRFVRSIAAQMATQLDGYREALDALDMERIIEPDAGSLLRRLIADPLLKVKQPDLSALIVVDALDEAFVHGQRNIARVMCERLDDLPPWVRLVLSTRKEPEILDLFSRFRPHEIDAARPENLQDVAAYVEKKLEEPELAALLARSGATPRATAALVSRKAEGNFLYATQTVAALASGQIHPRRPETFPDGLVGIYQTFFERIFPQGEGYARFRPLLDAITAAREPLSASQIASFLRRSEFDVENDLQRIAVFFPERDGHYQAYHKSLTDWLVGVAGQSRRYRVDVQNGHRLISDRLMAEYRSGVRGPFTLAHLPYHLAASERREELEEFVNQEVAAVLQLLEGPTAGELAPLLALWSELAPLRAFWQARDPGTGLSALSVYQKLGERMMQLGEPLIEYDVVTEGLERWPKDFRLRQLQAHALLESGTTEKASSILQELRREGHTDQETLGWLARAHKDLAARARETQERKAHLRDAAAVYMDAYQRTHKYWTGINAASMALLVGERAQAAAVAREVREQCLRDLSEMEQTGGDPYYPLATLGEAALIQGEWSEAAEWYGRAAEAGRREFGRLKSTLRQARLLMGRLGGDLERIERCFAIPRVAVFAGHMIDRPERDTPRFPPQLDPAVREAIRQRLEQRDIGVGYASAACGSDLLFLEAMLERGSEAHVILPYDQEQFLRDSVEIVPGAGWGQRYRDVLERATRVVVAAERRLGGDSVLYEYANLLLHGLAAIHATHLEADLVPLAVWDGQPGDGPGETGSIVARWQKLGYEVEVIDLAGILRREFPQLPCSPRTVASRLQAASPAPPPEPATSLMAILEADLIGVGVRAEEAREDRGATGEELRRSEFAERFFGWIAELAAAAPQATVVKNTWEDGLLVLFPSMRDAGLFALELVELTRDSEWARKGEARGLGLKVGLHAGPVSRYADSVTGRVTYPGAERPHPFRLALTMPPNQVYASEPFAALASAERVREFACHYVGSIVDPKGGGSFRAYHVDRRAV